MIELELHDDNSVDDLDGNVGDQITVNNMYNDPGYRVHDNDAIYDGTMSDTSNVDTSTVGIYHVKYDATDDAGNIAESVYRTVSVLHPNGSADVELPLSHTNPVISSNNTQLDATKWTNATSIEFKHHFTQIIQKVIVIKIENNTILNTSDDITSVDFNIIPIRGYLNDNNVSGVSIGHDDILYNISSKPVMITFLNVANIEPPVPFYRENGNDNNSINEYVLQKYYLE